MIHIYQFYSSGKNPHHSLYCPSKAIPADPARLRHYCCLGSQPLSN